MTAYTLKQASSLLQSKQISAVELATEYLAAIAAKNPAINGYVTIDQDKTLAEAKAADARIAAGNATALTGVPVAYKDIFCQTGWRSACSSKMLDNFVSPYTATVVQNLLDAGMVTLGRTNMDEFAMGSTNETSFYGATKNPWNLEHVPGGSSGGSAAVIAARLAPAALGSDTGGSIRRLHRIAVLPASSRLTVRFHASVWLLMLPALTKPVLWRKRPKTVRFC